MTPFDLALAIVLRHEGGFANHPLDPGGATNLGITQATLAAARGRPVSTAEVAALTRVEAEAIYRRLYWDSIAGDDLPAGVDLAVFDLAVNSGPARAVRLLQRTLGVVEDGRMGPQTLEAARRADPSETVRALARERLGFLRGLATWAVFGRGWRRRVEAVERAAVALASEAAHQPSTSQPPTPRPSTQEEPVMTSVKSIFASRTVWANLVGLAALGLSLSGFDTGSIDVNGLAEAAAQLVAAASFIASTVFRLVATQQLRA